MHKQFATNSWRVFFILRSKEAARIPLLCLATMLYPPDHSSNTQCISLFTTNSWQPSIQLQEEEKTNHQLAIKGLFLIVPWWWSINLQFIPMTNKSLFVHGLPSSSHQCLYLSGVQIKDPLPVSPQQYNPPNGRQDRKRKIVIRASSSSSSSGTWYMLLLANFNLPCRRSIYMEVKSERSILTTVRQVAGHHLLSFKTQPDPCTKRITRLCKLISVKIILIKILPRATSYRLIINPSQPSDNNILSCTSKAPCKAQQSLWSFSSIDQL